MRASLAMMLVVALAGCDQRAPAQGRRTEHETSAEQFTPSHSVNVVSEPGSAQTVGRLEAGHSYKLFKHGGPDGGWCKVDANGQAGWVLCSEGGGAAPTAPTAPAAPAVRAGHATGCATSCDHSPLFSSPPALSPTDKEVLTLCPAQPEGEVTSAEARRFIAAHVSDPRLQRALSAAGRSGSREANIDWLTALWTGTGPRNAFTHVFCGDDWDRDKLGGLHFLPRYAELEAEGRVCYDGPVKRGSPTTSGQYLIRYHGVAPWSCGVKSVGGFPIQHDAVETLALGVRAFVRCCHRGARDDGGVFSASDTDGVRYQIWCGTRNGTYGIATFYPTDDRATCGE